MKKHTVSPIRVISARLDLCKSSPEQVESETDFAKPRLESVVELLAKPISIEIVEGPKSGSRYQAQGRKESVGRIVESVLFGVSLIAFSLM